MKVTVEKGAILDKVVRDHYGTSEGTMEKVLKANRFLAAMGPVFDQRREIDLPEITRADLVKRQTKLWD